MNNTLFKMVTILTFLLKFFGLFQFSAIYYTTITCAKSHVSILLAVSHIVFMYKQKTDNDNGGMSKIILSVS